MISDSKGLCVQVWARVRNVCVCVRRVVGKKGIQFWEGTDGTEYRAKRERDENGK